jgi:hypothetical protein
MYRTQLNVVSEDAGGRAPTHRGFNRTFINAKPLAVFG